MLDRSLGLYVGACWTEFRAVCWQPTGLRGPVGPSFGAVCWQPTASFRPCWTELGAVCWQPTSLTGASWTELGAVCSQPTALMGHVGPSSGLYVGNLQGLIGPVGPSLGLYVGNVQVLAPYSVLWSLLDRAWGCMLAATSRSYEALLDRSLGSVCWQPTGLMGPVGPSLGLYVGNLQVL